MFQSRTALVLSAVGIFVVSQLVALACWLINYDPAVSLVALVVLAAALSSFIVLAIAWIWLENKTLGPMRLLAREAMRFAQGESTRITPAPAGHQLGELPEAVQALARSLLRRQHESRKAIESALADVNKSKAQLEAILLDLTEGIIVCNLEHRIVLFNQAASDILGDLGEIGLRRSFADILAQEQLDRVLSELRDGPPRAAEEFVFHTDGKELRVRMSLVHPTHDDVLGYVASIDGLRESTGHADRDEGEIGAAQIRWDFYDFDLFHPVESPISLDSDLADLDYVVFDTETTGLFPARGDEIIQIAGVRVVNGRVLADECFDELINPGRPISISSTRIHGITDDMVADRSTAHDVLNRFHDFCQGAVLVAHHAAFDMTFLKLKERVMGNRFDHPVLDTLLLVHVVEPWQQSHTLDDIAALYDIDVIGRHTAIGDSMMTAKLFQKLLGMLRTKGVDTLGKALAESGKIYKTHYAQN